MIVFQFRCNLRTWDVEQASGLLVAESGRNATTTNRFHSTTGPAPLERRYHRKHSLQFWTSMSSSTLREYSSFSLDVRGSGICNFWLLAFSGLPHEHCHSLQSQGFKGYSVCFGCSCNALLHPGLDASTLHSDKPQSLATQIGLTPPSNFVFYGSSSSTRDFPHDCVCLGATGHHSPGPQSVFITGGRGFSCIPNAGSNQQRKK